MPSTLVHEPSGAVIARDVRWARDVWSKTRGLIGKELPAGAALVIERARQIHTFGVAFPIDVLFCDHSWTVVHIVRRMAPRRVSRWVPRARYVVELRGGSLLEELTTGHRLIVDVK